MINVWKKKSDTQSIISKPFFGRQRNRPENGHSATKTHGAIIRDNGFVNKILYSESNYKYATTNKLLMHCEQLDKNLISLSKSSLQHNAIL